VDDEPDITFTLSLALKNLGKDGGQDFITEVDTSNDPQLALSNFRSNSYDLLIIDIRMPSIDGYQLYDKMKDIDTKVKVCFISAYDVKYEEIRKAFPFLEMECFIPKPIEIEEFVRRIRKELQR
jgi:CheY-like chemotaxis protein